MSSYCPSMDWDRYVDGIDEEEADKAAFYTNFADEIVYVAAQLAATQIQEQNGRGAFRIPPGDIADLAGEIVKAVMDRGEV